MDPKAFGAVVTEPDGVDRTLRLPVKDKSFSFGHVSSDAVFKKKKTTIILYFWVCVLE